ncbi:MAG: PucR family transcriptional regulator [Mycobacteriales bacterium]
MTNWLEPPPNPNFAAIPAAVVERLEGSVPAMIEEVVASLAVSQPEYAAYLAADREDVLALARQALRMLVAMAGGGLDVAEALPQQSFEELGRQEFESGRALRDLLAAYRTGARVAWRHVARASIAQGAGAQLLAALAEAVFAFVDTLSDATIRGYAQAQAETGAERERRRFALADLLLAGGELVVIETAAAAIGWRLPTSLALALVNEPGRQDLALALAERLGPRALPVLRPDESTGVLVPDLDAPGGRSAVERRLRGMHAVVGLSGAPASLPGRVASSEQSLRLVAQGLLPDADPLFAEDHLAELVVHRDPVLTERIAARVLAPLAELPAATRDRLCETLRAWLDHLGDRKATAAALTVHPQTVRYRIDQVSRLLGHDLGGADKRFELALALRARR